MFNPLDYRQDFTNYICNAHNMHILITEEIHMKKYTAKRISHQECKWKDKMRKSLLIKLELRGDQWGWVWEGLESWKMECEQMQ